MTFLLAAGGGREGGGRPGKRAADRRSPAEMGWALAEKRAAKLEEDYMREDHHKLELREEVEQMYEYSRREARLQIRRSGCLPGRRPPSSWRSPRAPRFSSPAACPRAHAAGSRPGAGSLRAALRGLPLRRGSQARLRPAHPNSPSESPRAKTQQCAFSTVDFNFPMARLRLLALESVNVLIWVWEFAITLCLLLYRKKGSNSYAHVM
jgi:hypothetical protein